MFWLYVMISLLTVLSIYNYYLYSLSALSTYQLFGYDISKAISSSSYKNNFIKLKDYVFLVITFSLVVELAVYLNNVSHLLLLLSVVVINMLFVFAWFKHKNEPSKTPLVFTARLKRIVITQCILSAVLFFSLIYLAVGFKISGLIILLAVFSLFKFTTILSITINKMPEKLIYLSYINKAKQKLKKHSNLKIVGITGSYGKTSVKFILTQILKEQYFAVCTPKSYNTEMGITKSILNDLKPHHEFFVVEMGADKLNDIEKICNFVKPDISVLTNIGIQHLKTFKSEKNLVNTKMQIMNIKNHKPIGYFGVDSKFVYEGFLGYDGDKYSVSLHSKNAYCYANRITTTDNGMEFFVNINKKRFKLKTVLLGEHNALNILIAVCVAYNMGVGVVKIKKAVSELKHIKHRLEPIKLSSGALLLDNSFNSNPVGAKHSLKVLSEIGYEKKIVITPGLVELGKLQYNENYNFAKEMAKVADFVCIVNYVNKNALYLGLIENGFDKNKIMFFTNFNSAFNYIKPQLNNSTALLLENDLPDNYI